MTVRSPFETNAPGTLGAMLRLLVFLAMIVALTPAQVIVLLVKPKRAFALTRFFHHQLVKLLGFRIRVHGHREDRGAVLFVTNHSSYLDIPVLGSLIPAAFVAKSEVARWPLFGGLAKLQRTVFIERRSSQAGVHRNALVERLAGDESVILFPEGTSSDGLTALPFKSSMFAAVESMDAASGVTVQPVSVTCTELDGLPLTRTFRPWYAWFGDMTLVPHLWNVFKLGRFTVDVVFHPSVTPADFENRKALALHCHRAVAAGIDESLRGIEVRGSTPGIRGTKNQPAALPSPEPTQP